MCKLVMCIFRQIRNFISGYPRRCALLCLGLVCLWGGVQDSLASRSDKAEDGSRYASDIYFRIDESCIDMSFRENAESFADLASFLDSVGIEDVLSISVSSYASPDGPYRKNLGLAVRRAESMSAMLVKHIPEYKSLINVEDNGEAWSRFKLLLSQDEHLSESERRAVCDVVDSDLLPDAKEARIRKMKSYGYIRDKIYPRLRYSEIVIHYSAREPLDTLERVEKSVAITSEKAFTDDSLGIIYRYAPRPSYPLKKELFYLRTNFLSPLTNVGAVYSINDRWSVGADWYFPWVFRNPDHKNCFQILGGGIEGRYWFGDRNYENRLEGHSLGLNLSGGYYDFGRNYTGNQGEFVNIGVDYLYSVPVFNDKMHLEFTVGLGYIYSFVKPYEVFEEGGKAFKTGYTKNFHWVGPSKAGISLVIPITAKRRDEK